MSDQATINNALAFYNTNITSTFSAVIDFSTQTAGGASSIKGVYNNLSYLNYYTALAANSGATGDASQVSAVASLPNTTNNPVTGTSGVQMVTTLASLYEGFTQDTTSNFSACGALLGTACITIGLGELGQAALFGVVQHEVNEVLGTSSALRASGAPVNPSVGDLFRYGGIGVRSYAVNADTSYPCSGATAYFSIDGGTTNLNNYNNCNNGGDYGDWGNGRGAAVQVQDAFGSPGDVSALTLSSSEVTLLKAIGYNFVSNSNSIAVPEPASMSILLVSLIGLGRARRRQRRPTPAQ